MAPLTFDRPVADDHSATDVQLMTRFSGMVEEVPRKLIVDMRELRSPLPFVLYKHNFKLEPLTIDVGDYVLTPSTCVERKSTSDLISSLNNGRLHWAS